ncbi:D-alanyl-D-alanine carboxypeptidase/D-alanyl-D-alanine endopeptidase [Burkholderia glumae]|uniref:D-alanyl-D-alanine carboxypeptidase/D-alanyl-D-alanine-endopeptidase n=1 Tax=Burkholderia glumae TaxID=337 RepID=A0AAP9Y362_BURGL|nr:D-alanyl-D-alanine carboxypeptidase/D-alanyl-D-alanine-endopeptidase [Burkholderia glumae]MCM2482324.1 D-alanyl-D-alanine carboxypeptidase/D-alanyl-D-alanine-endopeptidase [Burkholderia glumae]MCM2491068.1 D-alanyl-D-alanine carboxypeptidase/D-alanyl-D-alanine-endopeptidase [Burkholderia glumae]MCM2507532.1 D-alanyl-D-alanine carboxypeptidase/D-alanyl-D-alanine-endopeptidase [Burkholderia glumae]MCM2539218.1 D-alanyl-D-alanine carboxypeptidase/D-alanyl-D-alanine-endopeptidase [Burkholderia g
MNPIRRLTVVLHSRARHGRTALVLAACAALAFAAPAEARKKPRAARRAAAVAAAPAASVAAARGILPASVLAGLQRAHVPAANLSVVVEKIGARAPVVDWNGERPMLPASTMKLVTTYSGLALLGADYRYRTSAWADGTVDPTGTLHGNLYIKGTGDPKLVPEELIDLVDKIRRAGIVNIDGALVLDKTFFAPSTRDLPAFDDGTFAPYNVGPDPLLYAFKSLSFTVTPGDGGAVAIDVQPPLANLTIDNEVSEGGSSCAAAAAAARPHLTTDPNGALTAAFAGRFPRHCEPITTNIAVLDHSQFFSQGFLALWRSTGGIFNGRIVEGKVPTTARPVAVHRGPVLSSIVYDINKNSNNTMARNLFLSLGAIEGKPPATPEQSAGVIRAFLARSGIAMPELVLENGSGLSREEQVSALSLAALLQAANASPVAQPFIDSLPIVGVDGTMKRRLTNQPVLGNAHIKTGTLRDVRAIAGYVASADGNSYVVVSFINDAHAAAARAAHDALLEWVYAGPHGN